MERPSEDEVQAMAERTRTALEKITNGKIKAVQPKNVPNNHRDHGQGDGDSSPHHYNETTTTATATMRR
jgi:hypothetical protein